MFAGTRVPIDIVLSSLNMGVDMDRLVDSYPFLTDAHIEAAKDYAQRHPKTHAAPWLVIEGVEIARKRIQGTCR